MSNKKKFDKAKKIITELRIERDKYKDYCDGLQLELDEFLADLELDCDEIKVELVEGEEDE